MENLRIEYFAEEKKVKIWVNATLIQTVDVEKVFVIETEADWKSARTIKSVGGHG